MYAFYFDQMQLLIDVGADVNATDQDGNTSLHIVASSGNAIIAEFLLRKNADPNAKNKNGETPDEVVPRRHKNRALIARIKEAQAQVEIEKKNKVNSYWELRRNVTPIIFLKHKDSDHMKTF